MESENHVAEKYRMINDKDEILNLYDDLISDEMSKIADKPQIMPK